MNPPGNQYQEKEPSKHTYYPALDGVRGLAILLVLLYHNFGFTNYFSFGWIGVDLFFVLSGFLITGILLKTIGTRGYLKNFYTRRVLRIFPLYYLSLIIFLIIIPRFGLLPDSRFYQEHQGWFWTYLQNWLFIFNGNNNAQSLHHLWSLAIEEQFYLLWPLVILIIKNTRTLILLVVLVLVLGIGFRIWIWFQHVPGLSYYNLYTFSRADGLCVGCLIALFQNSASNMIRKRTPIIILAIGVLNLLFFLVERKYQADIPWLAFAGYTSLSVGFGLLVNEAANGRIKVLKKIFGIIILRFLGKISYGLYIFHWPVYLILQPVLERNLSIFGDGFLKSIFISTIAAFMGILVSWLSFRFYESYFLRLKKKFA